MKTRGRDKSMDSGIDFDEIEIGTHKAKRDEPARRSMNITEEALKIGKIPIE